MGREIVGKAKHNARQYMTARLGLLFERFSPAPGPLSTMDLPPTQFDDPAYWRKHAQQAWMLAQDMSDLASKETMHRIARDYEHKASEAELRMARAAEAEPNSAEAAAGSPEDREVTLKKLEEFDRQIAIGKEHIAKQREIIADLDREGHDISGAKELLENLLATQTAYEDNRRVLLEVLGEQSADGHNHNA